MSAHSRNQPTGQVAKRLARKERVQYIQKPWDSDLEEIEISLPDLAAPEGPAFSGVGIAKVLYPQCSELQYRSTAEDSSRGAGRQTFNML